MNPRTILIALTLSISAIVSSAFAGITVDDGGVSCSGGCTTTIDGDRVTVCHKASGTGVSYTLPVSPVAPEAPKGT